MRVFKKKFGYTVFAQTNRTLVVLKDAARAISNFVHENTYPDFNNAGRQEHELIIRNSMFEPEYVLIDFPQNIKLHVEDQKLVSLELM